MKNWIYVNVTSILFCLGHDYSLCLNYNLELLTVPPVMAHSQALKYMYKFSKNDPSNFNDLCKFTLVSRGFMERDLGWGKILEVS